MTIVPVTSEVHKSSARELIAEYLHWFAAGAPEAADAYRSSVVFMEMSL